MISSTKIKDFLKFIKIEHTLFDLPFGYAGMLLANVITLKIFLLITISAISARIAGMIINRIEDLPLDKKNPRTKKRELVTGKISLKEAYIIFFISSIIFEISSILLNLLAGLFVPVILLLFYVYPKTKKFYAISHIFLGFSIGIIVLGGYIGAKGMFPTSPETYYLMIFVSFWIAGFDIIYQNQDTDFDKSVGIKSIPVILDGNILWPTAVFYLVSTIFLIIFSINSIFKLIVSLLIIILLFLRLPYIYKLSIDDLFKFDIPIPFLLLLSLII
ncbi:MAG: 4-hydroxybenzoate octaprenyltransferase [Thermoplasmata archaeon]|nr:4-hydroxybenzoate octaprenyltransferase [Thermoplasmata archaeon]